MTASKDTTAGGVEVTLAMIDAGCAAWVQLYPGFEGEKPQPTAGDVVKAILAAALAASPAPAPAAGVDSRHPQYRQGQRQAQKHAVSWLHKRANSMNDPHAKSILDSAAFDLGQACASSPKAGETGNG